MVEDSIEEMEEENENKNLKLGSVGI